MSLPDYIDGRLGLPFRMDTEGVRLAAHAAVPGARWFAIRICPGTFGLAAQFADGFMSSVVVRPGRFLDVKHAAIGLADAWIEGALR